MRAARMHAVGEPMSIDTIGAKRVDRRAVVRLRHGAELGNVLAN
jgi:hypothetical protein